MEYLLTYLGRKHLPGLLAYGSHTQERRPIRSWETRKTNVGVVPVLPLPEYPGNGHDRVSIGVVMLENAGCWPS